MSSTSNYCIDQFGCPSGVVPDFRIKRHDTNPSFSISVNDCDGPIDLTDTVLEVSIWAKAKLKTAITAEDTYFGLADKIGFQQAMTGDIIVVDRTREPEQMLITGFDETNFLIQVIRGYHGTPIYDYPKGTALRIMRTLNSVGSTEMVFVDTLQLDGTTQTNVLSESKLIYDWFPNDTCLPGCYLLEMKLLKMITSSVTSMSFDSSISIIPSFISESFADLGCAMGDGAQWVRRFPVEREGYTIQIVDSPTSESLV